MGQQIHRFSCKICSSKFQHFFQLTKHVRSNHDNKVHPNEIFYNCSMCFDKINNFEEYISHVKKCNYFTVNQKCYYCSTNFKIKNSLVRHLMKHQYQFGFSKDKRLPNLPADSKFMLSKIAFKAFLQQYELFSESRFQDVGEFLTYYNDDIIQLISNILMKLNQIKCQFCLSVSFAKESGGVEIFTIGYFCSKQIIFNNASEIEEKVEELIDLFDTQIQDFTSRGSGWYINDIDRLDVRIGIYNPLGGSCYGFLPKELINKKAIINIRNEDNKCFLYSVLAAVFPVKKNPQRVSNYEKYIDQNYINLDNVKFPMTLNRITKFEENNNNLSIAINVYTWGCENDEKGRRKIIKPILTSKKLDYKIEVNLLLIDNHYFFIKNMNRLVNNYASDHHHYCANCFAKYRTKSDLADHKKRCLIFKPSIARMPKEPEMYFNKYQQMKKFPFVMYADFESILEPVENIQGKTTILNNHKPCGYAFIVIKGEEEIHYHNYYRGIDCMEKFMIDLKNVSSQLKENISDHKLMIKLSEEQERCHQSQTHCYLCKKVFSDEPESDGFINIKVRDHCHLTGKYNGAAHVNCNLNFKEPNFIPLFFHNLKGYDAHFIIKNIKNELFEKCDIIPQNMEKFIAFTLDYIHVLDSYQFLSESLDKLVNNLRKSNGDFPITRRIFNHKLKYDVKYNHLLYRKSIYPYEYMTSFDKFEETNLPTNENFFSKLHQTSISDEDYEYAKEVWKSFKINDLGEYHDFYVNLDTCLLADVFQAFRKTIYKEYGLEPCHFFSIPGLAWSAALKVSDVKLDLLTNVDDYQFFEFGIRGGMCGVNRRFCKANNPNVKDFNVNKETVHLTYLDFNNLYGWAMNQLLPERDFKWLDENEFCGINWKNIETETDVGYILEVDFHYPENLHNLHKDFPLAPHQFIVTNDLLSEYQKNTIERLKGYGYRRTPTKKLMQTLYDKHNYVIHFKNLKLYLHLGLQLIKIHRVIKFHQSAFLKTYIEKNTLLRQNSKNDFEKDLFKLMNNSVFGKSIQDQRKHLNIKLALNEKQASKYLKKPNFTSFMILDEDKTLINMRKTVVDLNRPIYIGFTVLELSKWLMYDRHYNYFKSFYGPRIELAYFDTDSFLYRIKTKDLIEDLGTTFKDLMDFSNFDKNHRFFDNSKAKVIGYLKCEYGDQELREFVGLKAKLYSILYGYEQNKTTAKGLQKAVIKKFVNHKHYIECIKNNNIFASTSRRIQSKEHVISTIEQNKLIFTPMDDKKYILNNGINTLPFGHHSII